MSKPRKGEPDTDRIAVPSDLAIVKRKRARSLGYKKDTPDDRDYKARALFGARRGLPNENLVLEGCVPGIKDQGPTSSCVGQAIGTAIDARLRRIGKWDAPQSSSHAIYTFARALYRLSGDERLDDEGSFPRLAMKGLRDWGVPSELRWPFNPAKINDELPWDVMQAASANRLQAWWRIDSVGKERVEDICQAIVAGFPVVFGIDVDSAFLDHVGKDPIVAIDHAKIAGGHMMCLVGYTTANQARVFRGVNSWGLGWGDRGYFWAGEGFVMDPSAGDFYVLQIE